MIAGRARRFVTMLPANMKRTLRLACLSASFLLLSCVVKNAPPPSDAPGPTQPGAVVPVDPATPGAPGTPPAPGTATPNPENPGPGVTTPTPAPAKTAEGGGCTVGADCESGVCEGQGCGEGEGKCVAKSRACTRDLRPYCGCDGKTFRSSGSCPGNTYSRPGECSNKPVDLPPTKLSDGAACASGADCDSGVCEGQGCGARQLGKCVAKTRMCTMDAATYCGCDGKTFTSSGSCPGQRFENKGECKKKK
jgi:hypothetical protein